MFYQTAADADIKKPLGEKINSARNSLGSMGSKLEERRNKLKDKVKTTVNSATDVDGDVIDKAEKAAK